MQDKIKGSGGMPASYARWASVVRKIQSGDDAGLKELYDVFLSGVRFYLFRQLGPRDLDDRVHDTFLIVVDSIRKGELREPERLMGFVRTVARRQVAAHIEKAARQRRDHSDFDPAMAVADRDPDPEERAIRQQRNEILRELLAGISGRDREILTRFYLHEQSPEQICREMDLNATQFRLLKSRAKARFAEIGRRKMARRPFSRFLLRASRGAGH
jgi:RNA polymerase sigma factor (sigma-70 family)